MTSKDKVHRLRRRVAALKRVMDEAHGVSVGLCEELRAVCPHEDVRWQGRTARFPDVRYCIDCGTFERHLGLPFNVITTEGRETKDYYTNVDRFPGPLVEYKACGGCLKPHKKRDLSIDWHRCADCRTKGK